MACSSSDKAMSAVASEGVGSIPSAFGGYFGLTLFAGSTPFLPPRHLEPGEVARDGCRDFWSSRTDADQSRQ